MPEYIVNKNEDTRGYHEVHQINCNHLPVSWNQESLGWHSSCNQAVSSAKAKHPFWNVDGCYYCSKDCHKF